MILIWPMPACAEKVYRVYLEGPRGFVLTGKSYPLKVVKKAKLLSESKTEIDRPDEVHYEITGPAILKDSYLQVHGLGVIAVVAEYKGKSDQIEVFGLSALIKSVELEYEITNLKAGDIVRPSVFKILDGEGTHLLQVVGFDRFISMSGPTPVKQDYLVAFVDDNDGTIQAVRPGDFTLEFMVPSGSEDSPKAIIIEPMKFTVTKSDSEPGAIKGTVMWRTVGGRTVPLAGVNVYLLGKVAAGLYLWGEEAVSDGAGNFSFSNVAAGRYRIAGTTIGEVFADWLEDVVVPPGGTGQVSLDYFNTVEFDRLVDIPRLD